jgi:hypothetical protein
LLRYSAVKFLQNYHRLCASSVASAFLERVSRRYWDVTTYSQVHWRFGGTNRLQLQSWNVSEATTQSRRDISDYFLLVAGLRIQSWSQYIPPKRRWISTGIYSHSTLQSQPREPQALDLHSYLSVKGLIFLQSNVTSWRLFRQISERWINKYYFIYYVLIWRSLNYIKFAWITLYGLLFTTLSINQTARRWLIGRWRIIWKNVKGSGIGIM